MLLPLARFLFVHPHMATSAAADCIPKELLASLAVPRVYLLGQMETSMAIMCQRELLLIPFFSGR